MLIGYSVGFVAAVVPPVVGLIMVAIRGRGRARSIGMIGFAVAAGIGIVTQLVSMLLPRIMQTVGIAALPVVNTLWGIVVLVLHAVEMIILAVAIIANRPTGPQPQPVAYGYNQPTTSG